jgi:UrcA family protein
MSARQVLRTAIGSALLVAGLGLVSYSALTQPMEEVTVKAAREVTVGRTSTGVPIKEISIESTVNYADLDLTTDADAAELGKRIRDAATSSCKDIFVQFPVQGSTDKSCIKKAVDGAMVQAKAAIDAQRGLAKGG